jgi:hypothetical protein
MAIGILALVLTVLIGFFLRLNVSSSKSSDQTVAFELASRLLEEAAESGPEDWQTAPGTEQLQSQDFAGNTTFHHRLTSTLLDSGDTAMGEMYRLDVEVWWAPKSERVGTGKLRVRLSRAVFVENHK